MNGPELFNSNSIICSINFSLACFFILNRKNWRGRDGLLFKVGIVYGYYGNHVIALSL